MCSLAVWQLGSVGPVGTTSGYFPTFRYGNFLPELGPSSAQGLDSSSSLADSLLNEEDITAAISSFGELWDIDPLNERRDDVSFLRACIRCLNVHQIPELLNLMVDDRRFQIPIEIESWEEARPILLVEDLDSVLAWTQQRIRRTFSVKLASAQSHPPCREELPEYSRARRRPVVSGASGGRSPGVFNFKSFGLSPLQSYAPLHMMVTEGSSSSGPPFQCPSLLGPILSVGNFLPLPRAPGLLALEPEPISCLKPQSFSQWSPSLTPTLGPQSFSQWRPRPTPALGPPTSLLPFWLWSPLPSPAVPARAQAQPLPLPLPGEPKSTPSQVSACIGPSLTLLLRRSPRLVAKHRGIKKSSLHRAQDLMCKKLKLARFASKVPRPLSCSLSTPSSATSLQQTSPPPTTDVTCPATPLPTLRRNNVPAPTRDTTFPLTQGEILQIKASCGIVDNRTRTSLALQGPPNVEAITSEHLLLGCNLPGFSSCVLSSFAMTRNRVFRFLSWNVRSLNDLGKCTIVKNFIIMQNAVYEELCLQEEIKWKQRSRIQWLRAGDANTKFFHLHANRRKIKNSFSQLSDSSTSFSSLGSIANHLFHFFHSILGVEQTSNETVNLSSLYEAESVDLSSLHLPFTVDEVKSAIFSSAPEKATGLDGLLMLFYQHFWSILKDDIMKVFETFYDGSCNLTGLNSSWICPIPKKKDVVSAKDLRPISLVHSMPKLISKVLAARLQSYMNQLINPYQATFMKGRYILDNFLTAHILAHHLHSSKQQAALLKIDFDRAFDHINWNFLTELFQARGFGVGDAKFHSLQFADDMLLFFGGSSRSAAVIKLILDAFSASSGLKINYHKSTIIPISLQGNQASSLANIFGCFTHGFPFKYLGLPLSPKKLRKTDYLPLIEKLDNRLSDGRDLCSQGVVASFS
uniref:Reverse transcriptase domain-containing protein n=1 Tax=Ananas comosus var. bracteatus TaxID=296719 RepID=A0A6V7NQH0_ANACO|nr:unnamed protein product [Ananas comosus var. bracteatus]